MKPVRKKNQQGFTLIELIVTLSISSLVFSAVIFFASTGMKQYESSQTEVSLQMEAQTAGNQIVELLLEAEEYRYETFYIDGEQYQTIVITTFSGDAVYYYLIAAEDGGQQLLLHKFPKQDTEDAFAARIEKEIREVIKPDKSKFFLADYVSGLSIDPIRSSNDKSLSQLVHLVIELSLNGRTFVSTNAVTIRNGLY